MRLLDPRTCLRDRGRSLATMWLAAFWLTGSAVAENRPSEKIFEDPVRSLEKSRHPWIEAETLLEGGLSAPVKEYLEETKRKSSKKALRVMGLLELYRGDPERAWKAWAALPKDPWAGRRRDYLKVWRRTTEGFEERSTENFRIRTSPQAGVLASLAERALEGAASQMGESLGRVPAEPVVVEIYENEQDFSAASTLPKEALERSGAIGICKFRRLMILSPGATPLGYRWLDALAHEYAHYLINELSGTLCPLWLHEGVARYFETAWRQDGPFRHSPGAETQLAEAVLAGDNSGEALIPFRRMEPSMVYLENQTEVSLAFAQVSDAVSFLLEEYGGGRLRDLLEAFRSVPREEAFVSVLGLGEDEVEGAWRDHLRGRQWTLSPGAMRREIHFKAVDEMRFVSVGVRGHLRLGDRFRRRGKLDAALLQYRKALRDQPDNGVGLVKAARVAADLGLREEVGRDLKRAVEKNPGYVTAFVEWGGYLFEEGRYEEARRVLEEGLEINPFHPVLHRRLGEIFLDWGDFSSARHAFERALRLRPGDREVALILERIPGGKKSR